MLGQDPSVSKANRGPSVSKSHRLHGVIVWVFVYEFEVEFIDSSKTIGNELFVTQSKWKSWV